MRFIGLFLCLVSVVAFGQQTDTTSTYAGDGVYYRFYINRLQKSTDMEKTWADVHNNLPFNVHRSMQWANTEEGYLYGDDGSFAYTPIIMSTKDGGKTWKRWENKDLHYGGTSMSDVLSLDSKKRIIFFGKLEAITKNNDREEGIYYAYSKNKGKKWKIVQVEIPSNMMKVKVPATIEFQGANGTITYGYSFWKTTDFGKNWEYGRKAMKNTMDEKTPVDR